MREDVPGAARREAAGVSAPGQGQPGEPVAPLTRRSPGSDRGDGAPRAKGGGRAAGGPRRAGALSHGLCSHRAGWRGPHVVRGLPLAPPLRGTAAAGATRLSLAWPRSGYRAGQAWWLAVSTGTAHVWHCCQRGRAAIRDVRPLVSWSLSRPRSRKWRHHPVPLLAALFQATDSPQRGGSHTKSPQCWDFSSILRGCLIQYCCQLGRRR